MQQCPQTRLTHLKCSLTFIHCGIKSKRIAKNAKYVWPIWTFLRQRFWLQPKSLKSSYGRLKRQAMKMNFTSSDSAFWLKSRKKMRDSGKSPKLAKYVKTVCHVNGVQIHILNYLFLSSISFLLISRRVSNLREPLVGLFSLPQTKNKNVHISPSMGGGLINGNRCCNFNACI